MRSVSSSHKGSKPGRAASTLGVRRHLGRGIVASSGMATLSAYGPGERLPRHEHESAHLCLLLGGKYLQRWPGREAELRAGQAGLYPEGHGHENLLGDDGATCLNLAVPDHLKPDDFQIMLVPPALRLEADAIAGAIALGEQPDLLGLDCLAAELLGAAAKPEEPKGFPLGKLLDLVEGSPEASLTDLAEGVGRHPTHVARAFRQASGMSVGNYRRRQRVRNLCIDLRTDEAPLSELAARHGYSDQAHMTRELKLFTGLSPGQWRKAR